MCNKSPPKIARGDLPCESLHPWGQNLFRVGPLSCSVECTIAQQICSLFLLWTLCVWFNSLSAITKNLVTCAHLWQHHHSFAGPRQKPQELPGLLPSPSLSSHILFLATLVDFQPQLSLNPTISPKLLLISHKNPPGLLGQCPNLPSCFCSWILSIHSPYYSEGRTFFISYLIKI